MLYSGLPKPAPRRYSIPNDIMLLKLSVGALAVYNYLLYVEDRKTYQCYPSYATIGEAISVKSPNSIKKYVEELEEKQLIYTEYTSVIRGGKKGNGNLKYTIRPIEEAVAHYHNEQLRHADQQYRIAKAQAELEAYNKKHPKQSA